MVTIIEDYLSKKRGGDTKNEGQNAKQTGTSQAGKTLNTKEIAER